MNDGLLVSRDWLERVDAALFGNNQNPPPNPPLTSLFYDVRPVELQTAWSQNAAGVWTATAAFVVNDSTDSSFVFPVFAPASTSDPGGDAGTTRFFVVWRGRWEMLGGAGKMTKEQIRSTAGLSTTTINYVETVTVENGALVITTKSATLATLN